MRVGIVGAGITGLTAAYELGKQGHQVTVFEARTVPGGLSSGFRVAEWDWSLDRFYRHIFAGDHAIAALAQELGAELTFGRPTTSLWVDEHPYPYDSPVAAALYPRLPLYHNLRAGAVVAYLKYLVRDGTVLEHTTAHSWLRRTMGTRAYAELWEPMLRGKFKGYFDQVNMAWFWARIAARTPRLGYFDGGFQVFIDRLVDAVRAQGGAVHVDEAVERIALDGSQVALSLDGDRSERFDRVLTTTSPGKLRDMVEGIPAAYAASLSGLKSIGTVVLILALKRSVLTDGTYWLNLPAGEFPCLSMVEHTNYQDAAHYGGDVIVYLGDYLALDAPEMSMGTDELYARYRAALVRVRPEFEDSWVRARWSFREAYAQPVPLTDHSRHVPKLDLPVLPNLYWASMHHVYPWDRGTNYAVEVGQNVAQAMGSQGD